MMASLPMSTIVPSSHSCYRISSRRFNTRRKSDHYKVVNGQGAIYSEGRYNSVGVVTVYLTDTIEACIAEKMYYFLRDMVRALDQSNLPGRALPPFSHHLTLWDIQFQNPIDNVFDLEHNYSKFSVMPSMMTNPTQDYTHLKEKRGEIQGQRYEGLVAPSSRSVSAGKLVVLFNDLTRNTTSIDPFDVELRLLNVTGGQFANQFVETLDFGAGEVRISGHPSGLYSSWTKIDFNH
ncbi:MAG: RES family NAD+ phosphorylase [Acidobacteriota bacterium]